MAYKSPITVPTKLIKTIRINGIKGRMLHMPPKNEKSKKFVVLYGQHSAIERMYSIAEFINDYGEVYLPDLPGFGGMDSFYKKGLKPSYDNYADYLYTFLKSQNLTNDVWFFANSLSSQILTRMLQKHPDAQAWVGKNIAFVGFASKRNFHVSRWYRTWLYVLIYTMRTKVGSVFTKLVAFNPLSIRIMLYVFSRTKAKMQNDKEQIAEKMVQMEGYLWTHNDPRTHGATATMMFESDLVKTSKGRIDLTFHNVITHDDQYFNYQDVERDFLKIYKNYKSYELKLGVHAPSLISDKAEVQAMMPKEVLDLLNS